MFFKQWIVRKVIWPYLGGYGVYNKRHKTILDVGLSREQAEYICKQLNDKAKKRRCKYGLCGQKNNELRKMDNHEIL